MLCVYVLGYLVKKMAFKVEKAAADIALHVIMIFAARRLPHILIAGTQAIHWSVLSDHSRSVSFSK